MKKILLKNAKLVDDIGVRKSDLLIEGEKIAAEEKRGFFAEEESKNQFKVIDLKGKYIFPGIIDAHTHYLLHSRGTVTADDFYQGSIAAAAGGVTTVIDYIDFPVDGDFKRSVAERKKEASDSIIDYNFHQVVQDFNENISKNLADLKDLGLASIKLFTTYKDVGYMIERDQWSELFKRLKEIEILPQVHAEDDALIQDLKEVYSRRNLTAPEFHPAIRPGITEALAVKEMGEEALQADMPLYIVHLSSAEGLEAVRDLRSRKAQIYAETAPHYLLLDSSYLKREEAQLYLMTPPLRSKYDNQKLWQGVSTGEFQVVATDHCAFNKEQKMQSNSSLEILPGIPGTETMLPLLYSSGVRNNRITIREMVEMLSVNPAKIFGLYPEKGSLEVGTDADLTVFDPNLEKKLTAENLHSAAGYSPYNDFTVKGYPVMTFRRGELIFADKLRAEKGSGKFIFAHSSSLLQTQNY
ncbi:dihydropyrimidinase [Halanaerobium saccharolyticum]|uniref:Dihydropyrimidinase n=1 Tax=Halanaerobium saccharolyticum TaxID=43595 RepID=A0A4V3CFQ2_9FIRM|nr:dihydropyrimidinase [Halanaerobium saccharolyticum]TDO94742.1 dihydropyrimidinase [Halanaerobium saccharolyticum]